MTLRVTQLPGASLEVTYTEPTQPTGLVFQGATETTATLACNPSQSTDNTYVKAYRWYVDAVATVDTTLPKVTLTGLTADTEYWVGVSAVSSKSVESEQADAVLVTTAQAPPAEAIAPTIPTNLAELEIGGDFAVFSWTGSTALDELPLAGYKVDRDGAYQGSTSGTSWVDSAVTPGVTYNYQVYAFTSGAQSAKASISITPDVQVVNTFAFLPVVLPTGYRAGQNVPSFSYGTVNGQGTVTVSLYSGTMPPGMSILTDGTVPSVTLPTTAQGTYNYVVKAVDAQLQTIYTVSQQIVIGYRQLFSLISSAPPSAIPDGVTAYPGIPGGINLVGGNGTYGLTLRSGTYLPAGLSLTGSGALWDVTGTCSGVAGQTYNATFDATSGDGQTHAFTLSFFVQAVTPLDLEASFPALSNFTVDTPYGPVAWTITGGTGTKAVTRTGPVPTGISSNSTNAFQGTPTDGAGLTYSGSFVVQDSATPPQVLVVPYSLIGNPAVAPATTITLPTFTNAVPGSSYSKTATATGGTGPYTWTLTGILPPGITFSAGVWTATEVGASGAGQSYSGSVTATPTVGTADTKTWAITVDPLSTAFVAPFLSTTLPTVTAEANVSESNTYAVSSYVDFGSLTSAEVTVDIETTSTLLPGMSVSMVDADNFNLSYDAVTGSNPASNTSIPYRLSLTYNEPSVTIPSDSADQAEWNAQKVATGVLGYQDFTSFATTAAMLADPGNHFSGKDPVANQFDIILQNQVSLVGGKTLEIQTYAGCGAQGGNFSGYYKADRSVVRQLYFQFSVWLNKAQLGWRANSGQTIAGGKCFYLAQNTPGQVYVTAGNHAFPGLHLSAQDPMRRTLSVQGSTMYFAANALDTGVSYTTPAQAMRRYGHAYQAIDDADYSISATNANPLIYDRPGIVWPDQDAMAGGSIPFNYDGWTTVEVYIDADNRILKMWFAAYGNTPTLLCDSTVAGSNIATYAPGTGLYVDWAAINYLTGRPAETGRPTAISRYDRIIWGTNPIAFPRHPNVSLPGAV